MARTGRQTKSFNIIRRGPLFAGEFHYSLDAWQLSREAMLEAKHEEKGCVSRNAEKLSITNERGKKFEPPKTEMTHEVVPPAEDEMVDDAIKQLCRDVIVVAAYEVTVEDGRATENIETTKEDKTNSLQHQEKGDGDVTFQDTPNKAESPCYKQNVQIGSFIYSKEILRERARLICMDAISKAVYQVSKENLDKVLTTMSPVTEKLQTDVNSNETFETVTVNQGQQKQDFNKEEQKMFKRIQKTKKKEEQEVRKYQEEKAKRYIKTVNKKYKERNEINAKASRKEMKEQQKALIKEKKREERNKKKEIKDQQKALKKNKERKGKRREKSEKEKK